VRWDRVMEGPASVGEGRHPSLQVSVLGDLVCLPDDLFVVQGHVALFDRAIGHRLRVAPGPVTGPHQNKVIRKPSPRERRRPGPASLAPLDHLLIEPDRRITEVITWSICRRHRATAKASHNTRQALALP
jgi:hypothetical protein